MNSPNDIVCARDGSIWFTDPLFGILGHWEGEPADSETPLGGVPHRPARRRAAARDRRPRAPNGLAFSPDEKILYVVESRAMPHRKIWAYDVGADGALGEQAAVRRCQRPGCLRRHQGRRQRATCGAASAAAPAPDFDELDGVRVYDADGRDVAQIHLPERCANLCFGGAKNNRLFMAASHSLYALYVNTTGAV